MNSRRNFIKQSSAAILLTAMPRLPGFFNGTAGDFSFSSPFFKLTLSAASPQLLYFTADSLGQSHLDNSPLIITAAGETFTSRQTGNSISYYKDDQLAWQFTCHDKRIEIRSHGNAAPFEITVAQKKNHCTVLGHMPVDGQVKFPCIWHIPGQGTFRISCNQPDVQLQYDAFRFDSGNTRGEPFVKLGFNAAGSGKPELVYVLEPVTIYREMPAIKGDPRFDGYRKNYINIFQLNPRIGTLANNSASDACTFTLFLYAEMARYTPALAKDLTALDLIRNSLDRYLGGMKGYGQVGYKNGAAWQSEYDSSDSMPSLIIAACYYILDTKDKTWGRRSYAGIKEWTAKMLATDRDGDGLIEYGYSGNSGSWDDKPFKRPANWWDTIGFGHADAYSNALAYRALVLLAQVADMLQEKEDTRTYANAAAKLKAAYYPAFFNNKTNVLAGWKSKDGELHDYYFMFVNSIAVCYGLLTREQSAQIMKTMLQKMKDVGYANFRVGLPGNLISIADNDYAHHDPRWGYQRFQVYENGGASGCYAYFTLQALYDTGLKKDAERILFPMLESFRDGGFEGNCEGTEMTKDWKTWNGECWGYEGYLVDNYLTLLAVKNYSSER
ncbi:amylo-alpha-1,6-glucosidase [Chitinophaga sp. 212800010-3]|uniref:alpha-L-rhamnosidase-related protein n=1 Tax=unclassified Chitinophaga TaxID=2619133 RepID=UPI002DF11D1F|nr:Bac-rhamnosid6H domain-containing protein [Chitinophaga sp. 212800010-3]